MAANQSIKQEKGSAGGGGGGGNAGGGGGGGNAGGGGGGMMAEENTGGSPVNSPSYPGSFPDTTHSTHSSVPFTNYDGATNMSSMASNVYAASLNSNSGRRLMETLNSGQ